MNPSQANNAVFAVLASKAQGDVPAVLRKICRELSTKVEQAVMSGVPYTEALKHDMGKQVGAALLVDEDDIAGMDEVNAH